MKNVLITAFVFLLSGASLRSQSIEIPGKPVAEIYSDFHYNLAGGAKTTGFSINRAYFGYNYFAGENFAALIKVEIGSPEELAAGSKSRRYAYYREASISYSKEKLNLSFGITGTRLYDFQQKFWGKRYLANTFQSLNGYGYVADLGIVADYKFNDFIEADISLFNGEGYSSLQLDNDLKSSLGITITPIKELVIRTYGDVIKDDNVWQVTLIGFAGYKNEKVTMGAEINYKSNLDLSEGHHAWGFSGTGAVRLTEKTEFFTRFDYSTSLIVPGDFTRWNLNKDGSFLITGFQYTFNKYVKIALDYQATFPADKTRSFSDMIFINSVFKF
ncbi:MAG: hypothetical protein C0408_04930 [Odoribacter sp.]|nr:hypothetical protein [Odoribacter sp.]